MAICAFPVYVNASQVSISDARVHKQMCVQQKEHVGDLASEYQLFGLQATLAKEEKNKILELCSAVLKSCDYNNRGCSC